MMFSGQKGANALSRFKWKWHGESSLTTGLLNDVSPEIELSDYRRIPSPGSESPSGLLNGESLNVEPIVDLDLFFERVYSYYCGRGLWSIITNWIGELLTLVFIIGFSFLFLLCVDWDGLRNAKCGIDAVESRVKPCDLIKEAFHEHPLTPFTFTKAVIVGYLGIISIYLVFCFLRFFAQLKETLAVRRFYYTSLHVTDSEIKTIPWASVLEKVVQSQRSQQLCVVKDLSAHDVVMRLMRKENYLIGMLNKGVLAFPVSRWVPGAGLTVKYGSNGVQHQLILTKSLELTLNWCILQSMFDRNFCIRRDFISNPKTLKKRLMIVGVVMLFLSPFHFIFMLVYLFMRHFQEFWKHPSAAYSRRWSNLSMWMFREFNEVDHLFRDRINNSVVHASDFLKQFPTPILSVVAKFISFVSGGFAAVLIIIAFLDESLLEGQMFGRNLLWYAAVFGTITAISRAAVTDELLVPDPEGAMSLAVQHTHYLPKRWRGKENSEMVKVEFETLFKYTGMMLLEEVASIFVTPYLLLFVVPKRVDDILQFIADFTVHVEGVGHVCSFSVFDFKSHGNSKYASPQNSARTQRSSQGKMEKSFLSFHSSYPSWEPDAQGKQFLSTLITFREQKLHGHGPRHAYSPSTMWRLSPNLRGQVDRNGLLCNTRRIGYQLGSLWLIDPDQNSHPYLLDWYYTSGPHTDDGNLTDIPEVPNEVRSEDHPRDFWTPPNFTQKEVKFEDLWGHQFDRSQSHLEASTSAPFLRESILQHHDSGNPWHPTKSTWWARTVAHGADTQTSFLEPPDFYRQNPGNHHDNLWDKGLAEEREEEEEDERGQHLRLRKSYKPHGLDQDHEHEQQLQLEWRNSHSSMGGVEDAGWQDPHNTLDEDEHVERRSFYESLMEEEPLFQWNNPKKSLSRKTYLDLDLGNYNGYFGDIYRRPDENPEPWRAPD